MPDYQLRIGTKFKQQGRIYAIEQTLPNDQLRIKDILSGEALAITRGELLAGLFDGELELVGDPDQIGAKGDRLADLSAIDLNLHAHAEDDPLERIECDHTMLDLIVVDTETRLPLGRPWLTVMLDIHSRMVHGIYLSFNLSSCLSVIQCLRQAIKPKGYVRELLVVDNGEDFRSRPKSTPEESYA